MARLLAIDSDTNGRRNERPAKSITFYLSECVWLPLMMRSKEMMMIITGNIAQDDVWGGIILIEGQKAHSMSELVGGE